MSQSSKTMHTPRSISAQRDRTAEQRDLADRANALPGVADVIRIYGAYQSAMAGARAHVKVSVPTSRTAAHTSR